MEGHSRHTDTLWRRASKKHCCETYSLRAPSSTPTPKHTRNSDHGLSFPSPETQTMVWVSPFPNKYRVWGGLSFSFGPVFLGPWSDFLPRGPKHWGRGRRMSIDSCHRQWNLLWKRLWNSQWNFLLSHSRRDEVWKCPAFAACFFKRDPWVESRSLAGLLHCGSTKFHCAPHSFLNFWRTSQCALPLRFSINSVQTRCSVKTSGFTKGVYQNRWFLNWKVFVWNSKRTSAPDKIKSPENLQKSFSEPRLLQCTQFSHCWWSQRKLSSDFEAPRSSLNDAAFLLRIGSFLLPIESFFAYDLRAPRIGIVNCREFLSQTSPFWGICCNVITPTLSFLSLVVRFSPRKTSKFTKDFLSLPNV